MKTKPAGTPVWKSSVSMKLLALMLLFTLIITSILVIRCFSGEESRFSDEVAGQIVR